MADTIFEHKDGIERAQVECGRQGVTWVAIFDHGKVDDLCIASQWISSTVAHVAGFNRQLIVADAQGCIGQLHLLSLLAELNLLGKQQRLRCAGRDQAERLAGESRGVHRLGEAESHGLMSGKAPATFRGRHRSQSRRENIWQNLQGGDLGESHIATRVGHA